ASRGARRGGRATRSAYRSRALACCPAAWNALTAEAAAASASRAATRAGDVPAMKYARQPPAFTAVADPGWFFHYRTLARQRRRANRRLSRVSYTYPVSRILI